MRFYYHTTLLQGHGHAAVQNRAPTRSDILIRHAINQESIIRINLRPSIPPPPPSLTRAHLHFMTGRLGAWAQVATARKCPSPVNLDSLLLPVLDKNNAYTKSQFPSDVKLMSLARGAGPARMQRWREIESTLQCFTSPPSSHSASHPSPQLDRCTCQCPYLHSLHNWVHPEVDSRGDGVDGQRERMKDNNTVNALSHHLPAATRLVCWLAGWPCRGLAVHGIDGWTELR